MSTARTTHAAATRRPLTPNIVEFVTDPQLLGLSISPAQETLLRGIYGLPRVGQEQRDIWRLCTEREYPGHPFGEVTVISGARGGKDSRIAAPIVLHEAIFGGHERRVAKGERGVIPLVAQDARAVKIAFGYIREYLAGSPDSVRAGLGRPAVLRDHADERPDDYVLPLQIRPAPFAQDGLETCRNRLERTRKRTWLTRPAPARKLLACKQKTG